jgi:hypothetical protein
MNASLTAVRLIRAEVGALPLEAPDLHEQTGSQ